MRAEISMIPIRHALRALRRSPGLTIAAIISLALGIGANTAIFSVTRALLLQPLPYANPDRLAILWNRSPGLNIAEDWFSTAQYVDIKTRHTGFEELAIALGANANLTGGGRPERVGTIRVSSNLLPMLGAEPVVGRLFEPFEDAPGSTPTAVMSHGLWSRRFGQDPGIVNTVLTVNGLPYTVIGVLPQTFSLPREVLPTLGVVADGDLFLPLPLGADAATIRTREDYNLMGLLKPGVTLEAAQLEMDALTASLRQEHPEVYPPNGGLTFSVVPLLEQVVGDVRPILWTLLASVICVLLIACANVANLLLARALDRRKEIAVRVALGAGRAHIVRQLLTESLLLAGAGGVGGILLALAGIRWIQALQPANVPRLTAIALDGHVLLFTVAVSLLAGLLFGLAPALHTRTDQMAMGHSARGASGVGVLWGRGHSLRRLLVAGELALAVLLLIGAGLLIRSFAQLQQVSPGFSADGVLTMELTLTGARYPNAVPIRETYKQLWERLEALPGIDAAGGVTALPLSNAFAWGPITIEGRVPPAGEVFINADMRTVGGRYFEAMQIPLIRGRLFAESDTADQPRAVIIDARLARDLFPDQDPIGRRLKFGDANSTSPWETIIGVVGQVKQYALDADSRIALYRPITQSGARSLFVVARSSADPRSLMSAAAGVVAGLDADVPIYRMMAMEDRVNDSLVRRRFLMVLLSLFAGVALVLAVVGIGGVMAYVVSQGTRDLGIRLALGATPASILALVMYQGAVVAALGIGVGLGAAVAGARVLDALLFAVPARDPLTFLAAAGGLLLVALAAVLIPAQRAARVDPLVSLRHD
jgi:predicted permease